MRYLIIINALIAFLAGNLSAMNQEMLPEIQNHLMQEFEYNEDSLSLLAQINKYNHMIVFRIRLNREIQKNDLFGLHSSFRITRFLNDKNIHLLTEQMKKDLRGRLEQAQGVVGSKLNEAALAGNRAEFNSLINKGANPNWPAGIGNSASFAAILSEQGVLSADVLAQIVIPSSALFNALMRNNVQAVAMLLEIPETDLNKPGENGILPICAGSTESEHNISCIKMLLADNRLDVKRKDKYGNTPLHSTSNALAVFELLKHPMIDANIKGAHGDTALHNAAFGGHLVTLIFLLNHDGIEIDQKNDRGQTPFFRAAFAGQYKAMKLLFERSCDINLEDKDKNTPLHIAAITYQQDREIGQPHEHSLAALQFLLDNPCIEKDKKNADGESAGEFAIKVLNMNFEDVTPQDDNWLDLD